MRIDFQTARIRILLLATALLGSLGAHAQSSQAAPADGEEAFTRLRDQFATEVDHRLEVPEPARQQYIALLETALKAAQVPATGAQSLLLVDRSPQVQAAFVVVRTAAGNWEWIGATAVSTGKTGTFEHFLTPVGVYPHTLDNPDYRAEGTFNKNHIRGYGLRGKRVFDFGWQEALRGWGDGGNSKMRLQMHATDPTVLEPRLGGVASEGCVRIPGTLNTFIDRRGILDADYEQAAAAGKKLWVLQPGRDVVPWPGRYLVVVDSQSEVRPGWSPAPGKKAVPSAKAAPKHAPLP
ncbi:MAG: hypothetical protein JWP22_3136 [Ramlibacter sp.]|nr:hypothetical protein [Ramlibacter sp.]